MRHTCQPTLLRIFSNASLLLVDCLLSKSLDLRYGICSCSSLSSANRYNTRRMSIDKSFRKQMISVAYARSIRLLRDRTRFHANNIKASLYIPAISIGLCSQARELELRSVRQVLPVPLFNAVQISHHPSMADRPFSNYWSRYPYSYQHAGTYPLHLSGIPAPIGCRARTLDLPT
jgi:hypothetical protein